MLKIRQATLNDLEILLEFEQLLIDYERNITSHIKDGHINYYDIESFIKKSDTVVIVAETNGEIIGSGYALIRTNKTYKTPNKYVYLGFMYVKEEHRGKGVNKRIMKELIEWGKKNGHNIFKLDVYSNNFSAINTYQKAGFKGKELNMILNLKE
ncbi:MAG: GNAT family N-acetyltransferase [Flavobacteriaceae bacterium]|nr:GNAT family N-acetyltransferase [Flavobacteriaceae bacterium]